MFLQNPNRTRKAPNQCKKGEQNNPICQTSHQEGKTTTDFDENSELLILCPVEKNVREIWSWYLKSNPSFPKALFNWELYENKSSTIGRSGHEQYMEWLTNASRNWSSAKQDGNFSSIRSLKQTVIQEQMECQRVLEKLSWERRKGLYVQFCPNIPGSISRCLREKTLAQVQQLPAVYVKDTEFDCKQMLVRYDLKITCKLQRYISGKSTVTFPVESEGLLLTQKSFNGHPLIFARNHASFTDVATSLSSQWMPWEKEGGVSYVERIRPFLVDGGTEEANGMSSNESSGPKTACLASFDTFIILACSLFVNDFDVSIPFSKSRDPETDRNILQFKDPLFVYGFPQRLHFQKVYKTLLDEYHYCKLSRNYRKRKHFEMSSSDQYGGAGEAIPKNKIDLTNCLSAIELFRPSNYSSGDNLTGGVRVPLITMHNISENHSNKLCLILGHHNPLMVATNENFGGERLVFHVLKLEMQPEFGLEDLYIDEVLRIGWLFLLYPNCKVILVRVSYDGRNIIDVSDIDEKEFKLISANKYNTDIQVCLSKLLQLITKLTKLQTDAEYFLRSIVQTTKCEVFIQSNLSTAPDITQRASVSFAPIFEKLKRLKCAEIPAWTSIDVSKITPFHWMTKHIPCTFPIGPPPCKRGKTGPGGGNATQRRGGGGHIGMNKQGQNNFQEAGTSGKKKKKKKKSGNRGKGTTMA